MNHHPKLVYLSSMVDPKQIKFCNALQKYFNAKFWFYEGATRTCGEWWDVDLTKHCKLLENVLFFKTGFLSEKYWAIGLTKQLQAFNPDIVMLGGFSIPSNFIAYRWAKKQGKKTIIFTERSRDKNGVLRRRSLVWRLLHNLYRGVDMIMTSAEDIIEQFRDEFGFGDKVVAGRYAADLEAYFEHPLREEKLAYTYLFANRMTEIYNPIGAIEIFAQVLAKYPDSHLLMNARGELEEQCKQRILELQINHAVEFLTDIKFWNELHTVYARSDILILPANFSNGNFTILEAMASGMGVVVSNRVLGIGKMVEDGINGFNCESTTIEFLNRIQQYIDNPQLLKQHAAINKLKTQPLSTKGTAIFFSEIIFERLIRNK